VRAHQRSAPSTRRRCGPWTGWLVWLLVVLPACGSFEYDLGSLAAQDPLPFSVWVTGGAFLEPVANPAADPLGATFAVAEGPASQAGSAAAATDPVEVLPLEQITAVLRRGRVFVRAEPDPASAAGRIRWSQPDLRLDDPAVQASLDQAREAGHDLVLVVERLRDGSVARQGVNGRWPVTLVAWLAIGLGIVIPDHTYESSATLSFAIRDVQTGELLVRAVRGAGAVDLSLVERGDFWGLVSSIVVPPFLVWDDDEDVVSAVREVTQRRLLVSLAGRTKGAATLREIREGQAVDLRLRSASGGVLVEVSSGEGLAAIRVRVDGKLWDPGSTAVTWSDLLGSVRGEGDRLRYGTTLVAPRGARTVQVLVQTLSGRLTSGTLDLRSGR